MRPLRLSYKRAFLLLLLIHAVFFSPVLLQGQIIYHHSNFQQVTGQTDFGDRYRSNPKFSDQSSVYIPEIYQLIRQEQTNWLSTWNPHIQLGRPSYHLSGFSRAFILTNFLSLLMDNPFRIYTILVTVTVTLTGVFFFCFLNALARSPLACLTASTGLSLGIFMAYWSTFVMFLSPLCWACGLLWLTTEFCRQPNLIKGLGISFFSYSLLYTGYPQSIVLMGYLVACQVIVFLWHQRTPWLVKIKRLFQLMIISGSGIIAAFPAYLDIVVTTQRSARVAASDDFFLGVLPDISTLSNFILFLTSLIDPFWWGNPILPDYPVSFYNGISASLLYVGLFLISLFTLKLWRTLGVWYGVIGLCFLGTVWPSAYLFAVHNLGFNLSRSLLISGAIIPGFIICAYAVDGLFEPQHKSAGRNRILPILVGFLGLFIVLQLWLLGNQTTLAIHWGWVVFGLLSIAGLGVVHHLQARWLLVLLVIANVFGYSYPLTLYRPIDSIYTRSPLIEAVQKYTPDGSRYALFGTGFGDLLSSNQETLLNLQSIHSYDSLSSRQYQNWVASWTDAGTSVYGRHFVSLDNADKVQAEDFRLSGVSLLLSREPLDINGFREVDEIDGVRLYQRVESPILRLQAANFQQEETGQVHLQPPYNASIVPSVLNAKDDYLNIQVEARSEDTLLVLSQQHHPHWHITDASGDSLPSVVVNDFYQGVILPPNTERVELRFRPYVLWSWIPQGGYGVLGIIAIVRWVASHPISQP